MTAKAKNIVFFIMLSIALQSTAQTLEIVSRQYVYIPGPFPSCHASTIVETSDGQLLCAFFGGTYEGNPDCCIWLCRYDGKSWSVPDIVADGNIEGKKIACYNPVLYQVPGGDLILFYKVGENVQAWHGFLRRSKDGGYSWNKPEQLPDDFLGPVKNKPLQVGNRIICGSSLERGGWRVHIEYTDSSCSSWSKSDDLNDKNGEIQVIQPTFFHDSSFTHLTILCRSHTPGAPIMQAVSHDSGTSWSHFFPTTLLNNNSGIDGVTLNDGTHLLVYNHISLSNPSARTPIVVATSHDLVNWTDIITLEDAPDAEFSYPSVIQDSKGLIHIVYTVRRTRIAHVVLKLRNQ